MGLSAILKKVVHSKSASQSSSNGGDASGRKSLDSSSAPRSNHQHTPRKSLDSRQHAHTNDDEVVDVARTHPSSSVNSRHGPASSLSRPAVTADVPPSSFQPPQHAPPPPPPKDAAPPQLATPEFKPFSISSDPTNNKTGQTSLPSESTKGAESSGVTFEGHPFPSSVLAPPTKIEPAPTALLPGHPIPTEPTGPAHPSYLSYTENIYSPTPYTPAHHLAYHAALLPPTTYVPHHMGVIPSTISHDQQRLDLVDKIRRDHHPKKTPLSSAGVELFSKAGMEVHDPEGKGTIDWTIEWLPAVVQEHVTPHELREYRTVIHREVHKYHIYPIIQPIVDDSPPSPSEELHYFRDTSGNWREIRGRAAAQEILRACGAEKTDETMSWVDKSAVTRERTELVGLVGKQNEADRTERVRRELERLGISDKKEVRGGVEGERGMSKAPIGQNKVVGDERELDGKAKVARGVAF